MTIYIDLGTSNIVESPTFPRPLDSLDLKRNDNPTINVVFLTNGVQTDLGSGATGQLGIKEAGDYAAGFLASASSWTKTGSGTTAVYSFSVNLNTTQIAAAFGTTDEPAQIPAMLEIEWIVGGAITRSETQAVNLNNCVIEGDEGVPVAGTPAYPAPGDILTVEDIATQAQAQAGTDNTTVMTPLRVAQAIIEQAGGGVVWPLVSADGNLSFGSTAGTAAYIDDSGNFISRGGINVLGPIWGNINTPDNGSGVAFFAGPTYFGGSVLGSGNPAVINNDGSAWFSGLGVNGSGFDFQWKCLGQWPIPLRHLLLPRRLVYSIPDVGY